MAVTFFHTVKSFTQFLWNWKLAGSPLVSQNTANLRADICAGCHNNVPSREVRKGGCSTCQKMGSKVINLVRDMIISGNRTTGDAKLLTCGICGCDNRISVWMPNQALLTVEDSNAFPSFCWKKAVEQGRDI